MAKMLPNRWLSSGNLAVHTSKENKQKLKILAVMATYLQLLVVQQGVNVQLTEANV